MPVVKVPMALIVVMCVARSAMTMAFADALPLTPQASNTPNVVHARYLRQTAGATTSEKFDSGGGRRLVYLEDVMADATAAKQHQGWSAIPSTIRPWAKVNWWLLREPREPTGVEKAFESLHLNEVNDNWFKSPNFAAWKYFVYKHETVGYVYEAMFKVMHKKFSEVALAKILGQEAKGSQEKTVRLLRGYLLRTWEGESIEHLLTRLEMEPATSSSSDFEKYAKQFNSPEFTMWAEFVSNTRSDYNKAFEALRSKDGDYYFVMKALARTTGENFKFAVELIYDRLIMFAARNENPQVLLKELELEKAWPTVLKAMKKVEAAEKANPAKEAKAEILKSLGNDDEVLVRAWLDYVYMISLDKNDHISFDLVSQHIKTISKDSIDEEVMKWLKSDITASQKRLEQRFEQLNDLKESDEKPSA